MILLPLPEIMFIYDGGILQKTFFITQQKMSLEKCRTINATNDHRSILNESSKHKKSKPKLTLQ